MQRSLKMYDRAYIVRGHLSDYCDFRIEEVCIIGAYDNGNGFSFEVMNDMGDVYRATRENLFDSLDDLRAEIANRVISL